MSAGEHHGDEPLATGLPGETVWRVPSLSSPDMRGIHLASSLGHYEAVQLFVDPAQSFWTQLSSSLTGMRPT